MRLYKKQTGFTLVEMMVAMGLLSFLSVAIMMITEKIVKTSQTNSISPERDEILTWIRLVGTDVSSIKRTMNQPANAQLRTCICGSSSANVCRSDVTYDLNLYNSIGELLATPPSNPTFYDANGRHCNQGDPNCFIQITTTFFAECFPIFALSFDPQLSCSGGAEFFAMTYSTNQTSWTLNQGTLLSSSGHGSAYIDVKNLVADPNFCTLP